MNSKLSLKVKLGFGICDLGGNLYFTVIAFWLMIYLTDTVGLAAGLAGIVVIIGKIWDAVTDPAVGYLSDRTRSKWGRRRPFIFYGSFLLLGSMIFMWTNPNIENVTGQIVWAVAAFCLLSTAYTLVNIPYSALTPELTSDFNERTILSGYRMSFAVVGTIIGAGATLPLIGLFASENTGYTAMGTIFGALMAATALITFWSIKESPKPRATPTLGIIRSYLSALKSKPFVLILLPWAAHTTAITILSGTLIYYFTYVYESEATTSLALLVLLVTAMAFIPVWVGISKRIGKKRAYVIGMLIMIAAIMAFFFLGHRIGVVYAFVTMFVAGVGLATHYVIPWAVIPDVVEYDYAEKGERREGVFYALWTFCSKIGQALAAGIVGWTLSGFRYVPDVEQTEQVKLGIRLLVGPIPAAFFLLGIVILSFYPITEAVYERIKAKVEGLESDQA